MVLTNYVRAHEAINKPYSLRSQPRVPVTERGEKREREKRVYSAAYVKWIIS